MRNIKMLCCAIGATLLSATAYAQDLSKAMVSNAVSMLNRPYVAHVLDRDGQESLVINTDELDGVTFVEYAIAMSLTPKDENSDQDEDTFAGYVQKLRYRDGKIDGYTSRMHYMTDWINNAVKQGLLQDVTDYQSTYTGKAHAGYLTAHAAEYPQLAASADEMAKMKDVEAAINGTEYKYIPKEYLPNEGFQWIKDGDIIAITTNANGLDIAHVGIAFNIGKKLTLIHASQKDGKVVASRYTLNKLLTDNKSWTGVRVLRVLPQD